MPYVHNRIEKKYLIICEGIDTMGFLIHYLNSPCLKDDMRFSNDIQACNMGGIHDLSRFIGTLKNLEGFDEVRQILVLRDAETDVQAAVRAVKKSFQENSLPVPGGCNQWKSSVDNSIKTAFTLLPNCSDCPATGTIEDLCWAILKDENAEEMKKDVQSFISQIIQKYDSIGSHEHKSRVHTYFSLNKDYISLKIGEAAKAGAFNWESEKLSALRKVIVSGF